MKRILMQQLFDNQCRATCGHCFRTFMTEIPEEREFCWECGDVLVYVLGKGTIEFEEKGVLNESNL